MAARLRCTEAEIVEALGMLSGTPSEKKRDQPTSSLGSSRGNKP
jgi:hypothetical protein